MSPKKRVSPIMKNRGGERKRERRRTFSSRDEIEKLSSDFVVKHELRLILESKDHTVRAAKRIRSTNRRERKSE